MTWWDNTFIGKYVSTKHYMLRTGTNISHRVVETGSATILCNFSIGTDRTMQTNKPDITLKDHGEKNMSNGYKYFCQRI